MVCRVPAYRVKLVDTSKLLNKAVHSIQTVSIQIIIIIIIIVTFVYTP